MRTHNGCHDIALSNKEHLALTNINTLTHPQTSCATKTACLTVTCSARSMIWIQICGWQLHREKQDFP